MIRRDRSRRVRPRSARAVIVYFFAYVVSNAGAFAAVSASTGRYEPHPSAFLAGGAAAPPSPPPS